MRGGVVLMDARAQHREVLTVGDPQVLVPRADR